MGDEPKSLRPIPPEWMRLFQIFILFPYWEQCYKARMRVIARNVLLTYARVHAETAIPLERWYRLVRAANWTSMDDIRRAAPKSKVLNRDRIRFEVAGGDYRLIAAFDFRRQIAFVKFIGTHAEYDAIDALTVARF
ncbi:type II toxin-antitoxin system HigB family toxin [Bradyrhizobium sediminis]|nr:type II toxin-antitoxin system HigB family toxin [Bradyrhizobium sediminis]